MIEAFEHLFIQILLMLLAALLYQVVDTEGFPQKPIGKRNIMVTVVGSLTIVCAMLFPVTIWTGVRYDLRTIPWIVITLYEDYRMGICVAAVMYLFRFYLGGPGANVFFLSGVLIVPIIFAARPLFRRLPARKKQVLATGLAFWSTLWPTVFSSLLNLNHFTRNEVIFFVGHCVFYCVATWLVVYLTENKKELNQMRAQLKNREQLNLVGELAASMAHEVRNPLTVASGFAQLLKEKKDPQDPDYTYASLMVSELNRAEFVIKEYLTLAKPQAENIELLDVGERVAHSVEVISSYAAMHNVKVETATTTGVFVHARTEKLSQVFLNILKNGIESMPSGGKLRVRVHREGDSVAITFADEGKGMAPDQIKRLGLPFYSTKDTGTGLGLTVCYRIVQSMNGRIEVNSRVGKGTEFTVILPTASNED